MQVKKFEASSMKEALELIKNQLGPEAIILSVKDRKVPAARGGGQVFEVTAAVSETTLRKMQIAQKKLGAKDLEKFNNSPARLQKEFINKVFEQPAPQKAQPVIRPLTSMRYIDIDEEGTQAATQNTQVRQNEYTSQLATNTYAAQATTNSLAAQRIKAAAQTAMAAAKSGFISQVAFQKTTEERTQTISEPRELLTLKNEIGELRRVIEELQGVKNNKTKLHPGAEHGIHFELSSVYEKLLRTGLETSWCVNAILNAQETLPRNQATNKSVLEGFVAKRILETTTIVNQPLATRYHVFVGPSGQGKTSSLVKLASHLVLQQKKRVAIATVDRFKVGASEQLRIFSQILNIPYAEITSGDDWSVVDQKLGHIDYILVDFPGAALKTTTEVEIMRQLLPPTTGGRAVHLVQSVLNKNEDAYEIAQRYSQVGVNDIIFTKLDESVQHGLIVNLQNRFKWPLFCFGVGPQIPEDFEWATKERVLDLILKFNHFGTQLNTTAELEE